jgi:hypothetical protein
MRKLVKQHLGPYAADELDALKRTATWENDK